MMSFIYTRYTKTIVLLERMFVLLHICSYTLINAVICKQLVSFDVEIFNIPVCALLLLLSKKTRDC